jgi:hypothetical protein
VLATLSCASGLLKSVPVILSGHESLGKEEDNGQKPFPLTPETRGLIGAEELALMKRDALLINCARGGNGRLGTSCGRPELSRRDAG